MQQNTKNKLFALTEPTIDTIDNLSGALLQNHVISTIPVLKYAVALCQTKQGIAEYIFLRKVSGFIHQLTVDEFFDSDHARCQYEKLQKEGEVSGAILRLVHESRDATIARAVALLLEACIHGQIEYWRFVETSDILTRLSERQLKLFLELEEELYEPGAIGAFASLGLFEIMYDSPQVSVRDQDDYKQTDRYIAETDGGEILMVRTKEAQDIQRIVQLEKLS